MKPKIYRVMVFVCVCVLSSAAAMAQTSSTTSRPAGDDVNLDIQLYLILASNREVEDGRLPAALDPVVKQLRESMTFRHFRMAGTFLNRVKNNGKLEVSWMGGPFVAHGSPATTNPSFSELTAFVKVLIDENNREVVRLNDFRFGTRVPLIIGQTTTAVSTIPAPNIQYHPIGLRTDLSLREGSLVIAGTLNMGSSGDALVVAVSARRAN